MGWTPEARKAAAEARRRKRKPKRKPLKKPRTVKTDPTRPLRRKPGQEEPELPETLGPFDPTKIPKAGSKPPIFDFEPPPPPSGQPGQRKAGGMSATGLANTRLGDLGEAVVQQLGMKSLLQEGRRQNPLDAEWDGSGFGMEVKAMTTNSTEYKVKMKSGELKEKREYAEAHGMTPATMIVVMDLDTGTAHAYWKEGIQNGRLTENWNFMGRASIP